MEIAQFHSVRQDTSDESRACRVRIRFHTTEDADIKDVYCAVDKWSDILQPVQQLTSVSVMWLCHHDRCHMPTTYNLKSRFVTKVCAHEPGRAVKLMWKTYEEALVSYKVGA